MTKKKLWSFIGIAGVLLFGTIFYLFSFTKPTPFPSNEESIDEIRSVFPQAGDGAILNTIFLDNRHVYVPFLSDANANGMSLWEWKSQKWKVVYVTTNGQPLVWRIDKKDPSTYRVVWNFSTQTKVDYMKLYLMKRRNYYVSNNVEHYYPGVQMEEKIIISENPYGSMQMPKEWISIIQSTNKLSPSESGLFTNYMNYPQYFTFRWLPYDKVDNVIDPIKLPNGNSIWNDVIDLENVLWIDESELE
ncbi:hypothetical protein ACIQYS_12310 [Psychrobacillus sp. NPDC096426]|uniref:hypothetical protein n=1 Tax=Psychrobacillus sp. NPDC096426 TaxID=3364491 RepID=UPI0037F4D01A